MLDQQNSRDSVHADEAVLRNNNLPEFVNDYLFKPMHDNPSNRVSEDKKNK